ncbi:MAG: DUF4292 domain-containing protein [Cyclonatronaceae bacterium]
MRTDLITLRLAVVILLVALAGACSPVKRLAVDTGDFSVSDADPARILAGSPTYGRPISSMEGRVRAQISRPGVSERVAVSFTSDREQTLISIRNNLGIEGGRIYADRDSVLIYDRIEKQAWKTDTANSHELLLNGFSAFNLIDFIDPVLHAEEVETVLEDEKRYKLIFFDGKTVIFNRQNYLIEQIVFSADDPEVFSTFVFENHAGIGGYNLPRTIRIFSQDGRSVIHLVTQSLELNKNNLDFDIDIPSDITIIRI